MFKLVLEIVDREGLLRGKIVGVDSTCLRADASMKAIVRRDTGVQYQEYLKALCTEQGIENPTAEDCRRVDRNREGKRTSNKEWKSSTDEDARITRLKDGRTRLGYKAEHVVDMESGAVIAADIHHADNGDTATLVQAAESARANVNAVKSRSKGQKRNNEKDDNDQSPPSATGPKVSIVADKGYHKAQLLKDLKKRGFRTFISVPKANHGHRWRDKGGYYTARAYRANRDRTQSVSGKALLRKRGELIERTFAHVSETGGHRRTRLRGRDNVRKRYLMQVAALNLGLVMRKQSGHGTPRQWSEARKRLFMFVAYLLRLLAVLVRTARAILQGPNWLLHSARVLAVMGALVPPTLKLARFSTGC